MADKFNAFVSYASEDSQLASEIVGSLKSRGFEIWYAPFSLKVGDNLLDSIEFGLRSSTFGILLLSADYFKKGWTNFEMDTLLRQSIEKNKKLLPIWHGVNKVDVEERHSGLGGIVSLKSAEGLPVLIDKLTNVMASSAPTIGVVPIWEKSTHRFLEGLSEIHLENHEGACTTIWEFLLWAKDDMYPIALSGEIFSKKDILLRVAQILPHVPERVVHCVQEEGRQKIWAMCIAAGIDPKVFE